MNFADVSSRYLDLRQRLAVHFAGEALGEVSLRPPIRTNDEMSFVRLVAWNYTAVNEAGRVTFKFLKELPPLNTYGPILPHLRPLRTWISHNVSFDSKSDRQTIAVVNRWFNSACGRGFPETHAEWGRCYRRLCSEMVDLLSKSSQACDAFDSATDGPRLRTQFSERLKRDWDAFRFDDHARSIASELGYDGIDIVMLRNSCLGSWRQILQFSDDDAMISLLRSRIEADILEELAYSLPPSAREVLRAPGIEFGDALSAVLTVIREMRKTDPKSTGRAVDAAVTAYSKDKSNKSESVSEPGELPPEKRQL